METPYYNGDECLRRMQMVATNDEILGFLKCNVYKYVFRAGRKYKTDLQKSKEDFAKAAVYAGELCTRSDGYGYDKVCQMLLECEKDVQDWLMLEHKRNEILAEMERWWRW